MYEAFFELSARPFPLTPDPDAYFPAAGHHAALALLRCACDEGEGVGLVVGAPGTGKTLLCRQLLAQQIDPAGAIVLLSGLNDDSVEALLVAMLHDLSLPVHSVGVQRLRLTLTDCLMDRFAAGGRTTLFIDEAQNLSTGQLEELRLLTNLEGRTQKAVQILLFGQERLATTLDDENLAPLRQRIAVHARLSPLTDEEVVEYVRAHLARVGGSADSMFTASAISEICEYSGGVPRRINQICHRALSLAFAHASGTMDGEFIHLAASQLCIAKPPDRIEHHHLPSPGAPRRIFSDLAFHDGQARSPIRYSTPEETSLSQMTVLEVGAEDDWPTTGEESVDRSATDPSEARNDTAARIDSLEPTHPTVRWRDEVARREV